MGNGTLLRTARGDIIRAEVADSFLRQIGRAHV